MLKNQTTYILLFGLLVCYCSPYTNSPINNSFHDLTAHYNAYFIANEKVKEIEQTLYDDQQWNYNKILPIHPEFDTVKSKGFKPILDDIIQKGSIAIQRHPGSKWEDDSYILVGKARYYGSEFADAIETYKYVNTHSDDDNKRHEALSELIRVYTDFDEYKNAQAVIDFLSRENLSNKNKRLYYLNAAYLYQKSKDLEKMNNYLVNASEFLIDDQARLNFVIAQTNRELGNDSLSYAFFEKTLKKRPNYELEFYTKLYMGQVSQLADGKDIKKARKYFRGLIKDPKNIDYQDKIYYELAAFEFKNNNLELAIENYLESVKVSKNNPRQKGLSYLRLAEIYYDSIGDYVHAKNYYDSTISVLPKDEDNYLAIEKRQEILEEFVKHIVVVQKNDSLLNLSVLSEDSLLSIAISKLEIEREKKRKKKEKEKQAAINRARNLQNSSSNDQLIALANSSSEWYFSNPNAISRGSNDFIRKWGDRPLEDNWRRSNKTTTLAVNQEEVTNNISESSGEEEVLDINEEAKNLIAQVPRTEEQKETLLSEIEVALYNVGKIYNLQLEEKVNATTRFEELLRRFPSTEFKPEVLYQLFLLYKGTPNQDNYKELLLRDFEETIYAKLVLNPLYREEDFAANETLKKEYKKYYKKYKEEQYQVIMYSIDSLVAIYPEYDFTDNVALLKVLAIGKTEEDYKYQYELGAFINRYPESELIEYANNLLEVTENFQQERYNSSKAKFIKDFDQRHYIIILSQLKNNLSDTLSSITSKFLNEQGIDEISSGNLILDEDNTMLLLNWFNTKKEAIEFVEVLKDHQPLISQKIKLFTITEDNFDILYETKDPESYMKFYKKNY